ncbi:MAG TPA: DUF302 domain-containing protein, partial [Coriobacteriia bacterium]|nr:DUF302 domain-containing protein [Coriobacteriia bacterium]
MTAGPEGAHAMRMDFTYQRRCARGFESTIEAVEREIRDRGFVVDAAYDLRATLSAKGFSIHPLQVYEVSLGAEPAEPQSGEPFASQCRIHVFTEGDDVFVRAIRPTMLSRAMDGAQTSDVAALAERLVLE